MDFARDDYDAAIRVGDRLDAQAGLTALKLVEDPIYGLAIQIVVLVQSLDATEPDLESNVTAITADSVTLAFDDGHGAVLPIDDVIINVGGVLPTAFLESIGVVVETKHGEVASEPKRATRRTRRPGSDA